MTAIPEKLSFADALKQEQNLKNNSDLANLAHAIQRLEAGRREATKRFEKHIADIDKLQNDIVNLATAIENGALDTGEVKELYNKADRLSNVHI